MNLWLSQSGYPATKQLRAMLGGNLAVDGVFGAKTRAATVRFEQDAGEHATGTVDLTDWLAWLGAEVTPVAPVGLRSGDFDGFVGWSGQPEPLVATPASASARCCCTFGLRTAAATRRFQRLLHLVSSGVISKETWLAAERLNLTHLA